MNNVKIRHRSDLSRTEGVVYVGDLYSVDIDIGVRGNCDSETNEYGNKLVNLCKTTGLRIVNGRTTSDALGHFTCITHNGASTVDYLIVSQHIFNTVSDFRIGTRIDSDHMPLEFTIEGIFASQIETERIIHKPLNKYIRYSVSDQQ